VNNNFNEIALNNSFEILKINRFESKRNDRCFPTDNKIFWKNQTDLEIEKILIEINNSKSLRLSFDNKTDFYKRENPKISLIITIYNQGHYIQLLYSYIQQQELKDIEIIFVDDASTDNSSLIIRELMIKDKRIIYLKNQINKKQFYSINFGVLNSKGEYILSIDPDDFILNNILIKAYETAKLYDLDILQFYMIAGRSLWDIKYKNGIICNNSNVRNIFYYGDTRNLPDKLIKREIYIKAIKFMKKELYNQDYHVHTDDTSFFGLIRFANSYGFLEQIGYFYNISPNRRIKIEAKEDRISIINKDIRSLFNIMKYFILQSDNNNIEKNYISYRFFEEKVKHKLRKDIKYIQNDFDFYIDVLNLYLSCPFFSKEKKKVIMKYKHKIIIKKRYYKYI
jgi:glycosyltransferase involved in cell wall biosynthesis